MPDFQLSYSGEQVNTAIGNGLNAVTTESEQTLTPEQQQVVQEKIGLNQLLSHTAPPIVEEKSGSMVSITDASNQTVVSLVSQIVPVQAGSGDPSPNNVRPISGWNNVSVTNDSSGQGLTAELPETVYGGSLDWTTGLLTVSKEKLIVDGVNKKVTSVTQHGNGRYYAVTSLPHSSVRTLDRPDNPLSDRFIAIGGVVEGGCYVAGSGNKSLVFTLTDQTLTTVEAVNAWLVDNPTTFVYDLAEPYAIQITPQQITLLKGTNNVWSNSGDTAISYVADTKMYIDGLVSSVASAVLNN